MGSKKSSSTTTVQSNQANLEALAKQNEMTMMMYREQQANQSALFREQAASLKDLNAGILSGQKQTLSEQQLAARNQELSNRAAGQASGEDAIAAKSLNARNKRIQEQQLNMGANQADRSTALAENQKGGIISDFIRRRKLLGV